MPLGFFKLEGGKFIQKRKKLTTVLLLESTINNVQVFDPVESMVSVGSFFIITGIILLLFR